MEEIKKTAEEVGKDAAECLATIGKNWVAMTIAHSLKPTLINLMKDLAEDAKDALGKGSTELKDTLPFEAAGVDEPEVFRLEIDGFPIQTPWSQNNYISYKNVMCRIGKKKNGRGMLALCRTYTVRYGQMYKLHDKIVAEYKDQKDVKVPALPEELLLGTYCGCLSRDWDPNHGNNMKAYVQAIQEIVPQPKSLASHFYMGDNYEDMQKQKAIFDAAYALSKYELINKQGYSWWWDLPPFDEGEAIMILLKSRARRFIMQLFDKLPIPVGSPGRSTMEWEAVKLTYASLDVAFTTAWGPMQTAIDEVKGQIQKVIQDGGEALVGQLKPVVGKILEVVKAKMEEKKEEGEEDKKEEKEVPIQLGDIAGKWQFQKTALGADVDGKLGDEKGAAGAIDHLKAQWKPALTEVFEKQIEAAVTGALGGKTASMAIVKLIIQGSAKHIVRVIKNFTTVDEFIGAAEPLLKIRIQLEEDIVARKDNKEEVGSLVSTASSNMWKALPASVLQLYRGISLVKSRVADEARGDGVCQEGIDAMLEAADHLFEVQVRALNALRVLFTDSVRVKLANSAAENEIRAAVRNAFRENLFNLANLVIKEAWVKISEAMTEVIKQMVLEVFRKDIAPAINEPLSALQLPGPLAQLDIISLAHTLVDMLVSKAVTAGMTKLFISLENKLFTQVAAQ